MPLITNFGDSNTLGNTTLQQNLTVQGASSTFSGDLLASSSTVGIGNVASPFGAIYVSTANIATLNTANIVSATNFQVQGNIYAANALTTTAVIVVNSNVSGVSNTLSLMVTSSIGVGIAAVGNSVSVQGNLYVSNSITTTNVVASLANISGTANVQTLLATSNIGIGISAAGNALSVQGNVYASNALSGTNLIVSGTIYYNEDLFKRGPYLLPTTANSATIQAWISATCNASSQPTKSWWATSPKPVYGNVAVGPKGSTDYGGSVLLPDGRVIFVPQSGSNVGFFNPATGLFSSVVPTGLSASSGQFRSGVLVPNGNVVFIPWTSSNVGVFNPLSYAYSNIAVGATGGTYRFQGGVLGPTGNVIMVPRDSPNIGVFNPTTLTFTNVGPIAGAGLGLFGAGVLLPNGNVVMAPISGACNIGMYNSYSLLASGFSNVGPISPSGSTWESATLAPNGNVIFAPSSSTLSVNVVVYNPTFVSSPIGAGGFSNVQTGLATGGSNYFQGSALLPSGNVVFCPSDSSNVGMFDPTALQYSNCAAVGGLTSKFYGCTLIPDGRVVFTPVSSANVGVLSTMVPALREFCLSPFFNKF